MGTADLAGFPVWTMKLSTFRNFVCNIVSMSSKKKMGRLYADHVIAFMKNIKTIWYLSIVKNPRISMCFYFLFGFPSPKLTISFLKTSTSPNPTIRTVPYWIGSNFQPKPFGENFCNFDFHGRVLLSRDCNINGVERMGN